MNISYGMYSKINNHFYIFNYLPSLKFNDNPVYYSYVFSLSQQKFYHLFTNVISFYRTKEYFEENYKNLYIFHNTIDLKDIFIRKNMSSRYNLKNVFFKKSKFSFMSFIIYLSFLKYHGKNIEDIVNEKIVFYKIFHSKNNIFLDGFKEIDNNELINDNDFFNNAFYLYQMCHFSINNDYDYFIDNNKKIVLSLNFFEKIYKKLKKQKNKNYSVCFILKDKIQKEIIHNVFSDVIKIIDDNEDSFTFIIDEKYTKDVDLFLNTVIPYKNSNEYLIFNKNKVFDFFEKYTNI